MEFLTGDHSRCKHGDPAVGCVCPDVWVPVDVAGQLRSADLQKMGVGRAGLHLGDIIHDARVAAGEAVGDVEGDQAGTRIQEGFLFETIVDYTLAGVAFDAAVQLAFKRYALSLRPWLRQVRLERDGIRGTPDALDPRVPELVSCKATRRTLRRARTADSFEAQFWPWVMQEGGYLHMAGLDCVRWIVWWQAGDYSRGKGTGPQVLEAAARFTRADLEKNWRGITAIAQRKVAREGR